MLNPRKCIELEARSEIEDKVFFIVDEIEYLQSLLDTVPEECRNLVESNFTVEYDVCDLPIINQEFYYYLQKTKEELNSEQHQLDRAASMQKISDKNRDIHNIRCLKRKYPKEFKQINDIQPKQEKQC